MKELDQQKPDLKKVVAEQQVPKQNVHLASFRRIPGLTIWELNCITGEINKAEMESVAMLGGGAQHKLVAKEGCVYNQSLNYNTAKKKFIKMLQKSKQTLKLELMQ